MATACTRADTGISAWRLAAEEQRAKLSPAFRAGTIMAALSWNPWAEALAGSATLFRYSPHGNTSIRITLNAEGLPAQREDIRAYQKARLGREDGLECLLELLPLPSPGIGKWLFYPKSGLWYLGDRATYIGYVTPARIEHLRTRIAEHRPAVVTFYGRKYENEWRAISGVDFKPTRIINVSTARSEHTLFVTMPHPTAQD